jgi:hypothetical protein
MKTKSILVSAVLLACLSSNVQAEQVKDFSVTVIDSHLKPLLGRWQGSGAGGRFKEVSNYRWGLNEKSLLVDMEFFWDGQKSGEAHGILGVDGGTQTVYFNLVTEDGTMLMQKQTNPGNAQLWQMDVVATGQGTPFPNHFKTVFREMHKNTWKSDVLWENDGEWNLIDTHDFKRINK